MTTIDRYSQSAVALELSFGSTGFLWQHDEQRYLVTNWHVVSGRNPFTGAHLSEATLIEPDRAKLVWADTGSAVETHSAEVHLRDEVGQPLWRIHPALGRKVDIAALPIPTDVASEVPAINLLPMEALQLGVGMDVFVVGYPYGISASGLPIWKRASVASEPEIVTPDRPYWLADTATRQGMSGSPVFRRSWGFHMLANGASVGGVPSATELVGIYSGRFEGAGSLDAQLGMVWPVALLHETIELGSPDE